MRAVAHVWWEATKSPSPMHLPPPAQGLRSVPGVLLPGATKPAFWDYGDRLGIVSLLVACPGRLARVGGGAQGQQRLLHHNFVVSLAHLIFTHHPVSWTPVMIGTACYSWQRHEGALRLTSRMSAVW